jgi:two-component system, response regulator
MAQKYILLVDDNPRDVELTRAAISKLDIEIEVVVVNDGDQALDYLFRRNDFEGLEKSQPALILLDLKMPKVNGMEVLRIAKSEPDLLTIPIIILSSSEQDIDVYQSYGYGANAYVVKPIDFIEFTESIRTIFYFWLDIIESVKPKSP